MLKYNALFTLGLVGQYMNNYSNCSRVLYVQYDTFTIRSMEHFISYLSNVNKV